MAERITPDNWDQGGELTRWVYLHPEKVFPATVVRRGGDTRPLPTRLRPELGEFVLGGESSPDQTLAEFLATSSLDGFLIVHDGAIVFEEYPRMRADDRHMIFSVTKAFVGTILSLLEDEGRIDIGDPIERYLPALGATDWAGTSVRDIADMASGMEGSETSIAAYTDPTHKHYQLEVSLGWRSPQPDMPESVQTGDTYRLLETFRREQPAGAQQVYTSANTAVLAWLIETVTSLRLAEAIAERIWSRIGAQQDALLLENARGIPIAHGGMVMTLRDLARFGLQFTPSAAWAKSTAIVPTRVRERFCAPVPERTIDQPATVRHGRYQWDVASDAGELVKGGFADQLLFIDTAREVVIAYAGTNSSVDAMPTRLPLRALVAHYF